MEDKQLNPKFIEYTFKDDVKVKINIDELLRYKSNKLSDATIFFRLLGIDEDSPFKNDDQTKVFKRWEIKDTDWKLLLQFIRNGIIFHINYRTEEKFEILRHVNSIFQIPSLNRYLDEYIERKYKLDEISYNKEISYNPTNPKEDYLKKYIWKVWSNSENDMEWSVCDKTGSISYFFKKLIE